MSVCLGKHFLCLQGACTAASIRADITTVATSEREREASEPPLHVRQHDVIGRVGLIKTVSSCI